MKALYNKPDLEIKILVQQTHILLLLIEGSRDT